MEFLVFVLLGITILMLLIWPTKEKIIFSVFVCTSVLTCFMYFVASYNSVLPSVSF